MNEDQVEGRAKEAAGAVKEAAAKATGDKSGQVRGAAEQVLGKTQAIDGDKKNALDKKQ